MLETEIQEWEEYDARLLDDSPLVHSAPARRQPASEYRPVADAFETPFLMGGNAGTFDARSSPAQELETEVQSESLQLEDSHESRVDEAESFQVDPYSSIRSAMSPEHANLPADEITVRLGRMPATLLLHQLVHSPTMQQATLAGLLGKGARRSVRIHGSDVSIPAYLRVVSRLCREVAEEYDVPTKVKPGSAPPGPRGIKKYSDVMNVEDYWNSYKVAIQGVSGKPKLKNQQKAAQTDAIADACVKRLKIHRDQMQCLFDTLQDEKAKPFIQVSLNTAGPWGDLFNGALQTLSGGDKSPEETVKDAADLADQAILASGQLDENIWNVFMKCKKP